MITYLEGEILRKSLDHVVVLNNGVGYKVHVSDRIYSQLKEDSIELHIYTHIREDRFNLYGFLELSELELFEKLLGVSRIGPKAGLNILSSMPVKQFKLAVAEGKVEELKQVKGVGKKTAKRLILELQEKINLDKIIDDSNKSVDNGKINDAVEALTNLGYQKLAARKAVNQACQDSEKELSLEELIKEALGYFN